LRACLPASLLTHFAVGLGKLFLGEGHLVVSGKVLAENAEHDERHDAREEHEDDERVDDGEPVDVVVCHLQVHVPVFRV